MNTQEQMNHLQDLIRFLEKQQKGLRRWNSPTNTTWLTETIDFFNKHTNIDSNVKLSKIAIAFQNEFQSFAVIWLKHIRTDKSTATAYMKADIHLGNLLMAGVYIRHLTRIYKELIEALDNKPQKENHD